MANYEVLSSSNSKELKETPLYGSSRLGIHKYSVTTSIPTSGTAVELMNHWVSF